jgi:F420H(2)-dependent quinone reductase
VTVGAQTVDVVARRAVGDERIALWQELTATNRHLQRAATKARRELPVIVLARPASGS